MVTEKSVRRMPLRDLLTHTEKYTRDLIEHLRGSLVPQLTEVRELSRPVRRRSSYPTMVAVQNSLRKMQQATEETRQMVEYLQQRLEEVRTHSRRP
jgi:hypothetical protein